ncbi:MAG TPA: substrate-binding domain-containing protein [Kiritimatiellia bacterium]|jgi:LacI family transcriptional regulator|nr:substrate-binding domain-containing protein [Kiritimatiellia bacterium]
MPENPIDNAAGSLPKHRRVFETLKEEILAGKYDKRRRLPSEAQLVRQFGISRPTVSRALRDLKVAGFLDRRPGSGTYLSQTARPSSGYFGMIIPGHGSTEIFTPICAEIARRSQQAGYTLLWGDSSSTDLETRANQALELCAQYVRQEVAGVFLEPLELIPGREAINQEIIRTLSASRIPVVLIDRDIASFPERSAYDLVGIDNLAAGYRLAAHLIKTGARAITFVSRPGSAPTVLKRIAGVHDALLNAGIHWGPERIVYGNPDDEAFVWQVVGSSAEQRPDALICANDATAARLMVTLNRLGITVPKHIRLASFDDVQYASLLSPPLTTIHQPCEQLGAVAVQTLLQRLREPDTPPREILLDARLVIRRSCGAGS